MHSPPSSDYRSGSSLAARDFFSVARLVAGHLNTLLVGRAKKTPGSSCESVVRDTGRIHLASLGVFQNIGQPQLPLPRQRRQRVVLQQERQGVEGELREEDAACRRGLGLGLGLGLG